MKYKGWSVRQFLVLAALACLAIVLARASFASAALTFTGTSVTGDSNSSVDATGTVTIGASSATGITIGRSGITAIFPGSVTVSGSTTTLQNLVVSGNCTGCGVGNFTAGGDLSGSSTSQTVIGLQGRAISSTVPSANQVLTWNGTFWTPANTGSGITSINGLSNATTSIVGAGTVTVSTSTPNVITITGTGSGAITINGLTTSTFSIQGAANQIAIATSSPNIVSLSLPQNIGTSSVPTFGGIILNGNATTTNLTLSGITGSTQCLHVNASGTVSGTGGDCGSGGGGSITLNGITSSTFTFAGSGGLSVSTSSNPNTITYTFANSGFVTAASSVTWTAPQTFDATTTFLGPIVESSTGAGSVQLTEGACPAGSSGNDILCADSTLHALKSSFNDGSFFAIPQLAGDLGGTASTPMVVGLQGNPVSSTAPSTNQVLTWNGSSWAPANTGSGITAINGLSNSTTSIAAGSGISISTSSPNIITITATGGGASSTWSALTNPTANLSLSMSTYTTTLTFGTSTTNPFLIQDTTGNTATSSLFQVSTVGTSAASPVKFTAQGTANGVQMNSSGTLNAIGTGNINATEIQGVSIATATPSTNQVLTYNGSSWAPANASGTGGGSGGSLSTSSAITTGTFPFWANTTGGLSGTSTVSVSGNTITNTGNAQIGGTLNVTGTATLATTTILGNVAFGTSTVNSDANFLASYGTTGTTTLMLGATTTARVGCIEMVADGGSLIDYLTFSSTGTLQYSTSTCL